MKKRLQENIVKKESTIIENFNRVCKQLGMITVTVSADTFKPLLNHFLRNYSNGLEAKEKLTEDDVDKAVAIFMFKYAVNMSLQDTVKKHITDYFTFLNNKKQPEDRKPENKKADDDNDGPIKFDTSFGTDTVGFGGGSFGGGGAGSSW